MVDGFTEFGALLDVVVKDAAEAFVDDVRIAREWEALSFTAPPVLSNAHAESTEFIRVLQDAGATVRRLPRGDDVGLDSIYARDASVVTPKGMLICRMGKPLRVGEPAAQRIAYEQWGMPIAGEIRAPGTVEGGDVVWLTPRIAAVGRGYRTNAEGIRQFREILGDAVDELIVVPLPHWRGKGDVFHLMSMISPVDRDLAVVYSPLLPVPFHEQLEDLGFACVEVPHGEFDSMGCNVLALAPRQCLMVDGNPITRERLERAGAEVTTYRGEEISLKGGGGPTCLTRPLRRDRV